MNRKTINTISAGSHPMYRIDEADNGLTLFICLLDDEGNVIEEVRLMRSAASTIARALLKAGGA